jgi:hypothetical protein
MGLIREGKGIGFREKIDVARDNPGTQEHAITLEHKSTTTELEALNHHCKMNPPAQLPAHRPNKLWRQARLKQAEH